ncbi:dihydroorotase [Oscillatoria sp. CS-180]|uniref:dihydroorotase n=1 Tax=Oscillatoria sp. CS-180 TaxID=3021720 RepID=UPI00232A8E5E|nr:dihydroorotase [Oscillatoria sp. CS-180]MDB9529094.1 dihydroorotase [Oscillatoria sp. CS-180]
MTSTLLRQVRIVDPGLQIDQIADVLMVDGKFQAIAPTLADPPEETQVIDGTGKLLAPGLIDLYSNSSEPGNESRESLADLMAGAIAGGFTRVGILPTTLPPLDTPGAIHHFVTLAQQSVTPRPQLLPWAALTQGTKGEQMTELAELAASNIPLAGFANGQPISHPVLLRRLLEYAKPLNQPVALWPCDLALVGNGIARDGSLALMGGLAGIPVAAETAALALIVELVQEIGTPVHLMRLSTARSVQLIERTKAEKLPITASTTWMHLMLSTSDTLSYDPNLRLSPPLGNPEDQAALIAGIKAGVVEAIAVDHSPYTYEEKTVAFEDAPPGAIGLALAFPTLWQRFVASGEWTATELLAPLTTHPASCLRQNAGKIAVGNPVEALLFNPQAEWTIERETVRSPAQNTPFLHQHLQGKVTQVWTQHSY